jgi:hypothetical protein
MVRLLICDKHDLHKVLPQIAKSFPSAPITVVFEQPIGELGHISRWQGTEEISHDCLNGYAKLYSQDEHVVVLDWKQLPKTGSPRFHKHSREIRFLHAVFKALTKSGRQFEIRDIDGSIVPQSVLARRGLEFPPSVA